MKQNLYEEGRETFPGWWIVLENALFFVPWLIGLVIMWPLRIAGIPVASLGYALLILVTVWWLLKVHNCSNCYYYNKWCHLGWGKYTALFCRQNAGNQELGSRLTIVYMILPMVPILGALAVVLLQGFSWVLLGAVVVFVALNAFQLAVVRPHGCTHCKKRYDCPGSAAK